MADLVQQDNKKSPRRAQNIAWQGMTRKYFPILQQLQDVQTYRLLKEDVLTAAQQIVLKFALSEAKLNKASFYQLMQGFEILNKAQRLESNQSTENIEKRIFGSIDINKLTKEEK